MGGCSTFIDCGRDSGHKSVTWSQNVNATACLNSTSGVFQYGVYVNAVPLTIETRVVKKYVYALFWGFQVCISFFSFIFFSFVVMVYICENPNKFNKIHAYI